RLRVLHVVLYARRDRPGAGRGAGRRDRDRTVPPRSRCAAAGAGDGRPGAGGRPAPAEHAVPGGDRGPGGRGGPPGRRRLAGAGRLAQTSRPGYGQRGTPPHPPPPGGMQMFTGLGHGTFQVTDLEASASYAREVLGLREMDRLDGVVYLTHGPAQPSIAYRQGPVTALDHFALQVTGPEALDELRGRLQTAGVTITAEGPLEPYVETGIRFAAPDGHVVEAFIPTASDS